MIKFSRVFITLGDAKEVFYTVEDLDLMAAIAKGIQQTDFFYASDWFHYINYAVKRNHLTGVIPMKQIVGMLTISNEEVKNFLDTLVINDFNVLVCNK